MPNPTPPAASSLADFARAVAASLATSGSTAYSYAFNADGSTTQPASGLQASDGIPVINPAAGYAFTDCSGWISYALDSVAPLHQAVAAAERTAPEFNKGETKTTGRNVDLEEATKWGWARADVLAQLFNTATGANGFTKVDSFTGLQPGDLVAYALGIYADPDGDATTDPSLGNPHDTGHTMVVVGTPVPVTDPATLAGVSGMSSSVVAVYAIPVVDSSSLHHFTTPEADSRSYEVPDGTPAWLGAKDGGLGTGTMWFGLDASGQVVQFCFSGMAVWKPTQDGSGTEKLLFAAARLTDTVDLSAARLEDGWLDVRVYPNASPVLDGTDYAGPELVTGTGNLRVSGGGTLSLGAGNSFTGSTEVQAGTTLSLSADDSLGASGNRLTLDGGATLRLLAPMTFSHAVDLDGAATLDLSGNSIRLSGTLDLASHSVLTLTSTTAGGELKLNDHVSDLGTVVVGKGAALTLTSDGGVPNAITLEAGATLNVHSSATLFGLQVSGAATLAFADGATLYLPAGFLAGSGEWGALTVSGDGELDFPGGAAPVKAGQTVFTGTLAELDGQTLGGFKIGDVLDVPDIDPTHALNYAGTGVTALYDNGTGTLTISQDGRSSVVHLTAGLTTAATDGTQAEFTVRTDGSGGTLIGTATATGSQDSDALRATQARANGGPTGQNVTVGVISVSFDTLGGAAQDKANGFLPQDTTVLTDPGEPSSDEGRQMARVVHGIAPDAAISFAYAGSTAQSLADAIKKLVDNHVQVIVDDISVFDDRVYQAGGVVAQAIQNAVAHGVTLVTSAANVGLNYYEHAFTMATASLPDGAAGAFDFALGQGSKDYLQKLQLSPTSGDVTITLAWDEPAQGSPYTLDLRVYKLENGQKVLADVIDTKPSPTNPSVRTVTIKDSGGGGTYYLAVTGPAGVSGTFKYIIHHEGYDQVIQDNNANHGSGAIFGHALNPNEITVAAVNWKASPSTTTLPPASKLPFANEPFSAPGKGVYLFDSDGNRIPDGGEVLDKPDVSGIDGAPDDVGGSSGVFLGTSAAAPSIAGVAALMLSANPDLTPAQVKAVLKASAAPMDDPLVAGAGLVQADKAVALARQPAFTSIAAATDQPGTPLAAGHVVTFTLTADTALTVTAAADGSLPTLTLDDGGTAMFDLAASSPAALLFRTTIALGQASSDLTVTGLSLNGATLANAAGLLLTPGTVGTVPGAATGVVVDTAAPVVTVTLPVDGPVNGLAGIAEPGAMISVSGDPIGNLGTATAGADGRWSFLLPGLPDGKELITVTAKDAAGNQGTTQLPLSIAGGLAGTTRLARSGETLAAGNGPDTLTAGGAGVHLIGGSGRTELIGAESGAATLTGGTGGTVFVTRGGSTVLQGGSGHDTVQAPTGDVTVLGGAGGSLMQLGAGSATVVSQGADTVVGGSGAVLIAAPGPGATVFAGTGPGVFLNGDGRSVFVGGAGSATVFSGAGGGLFSGGSAGNNVLVGGQGAATLFGGGSGDALFAAGSAGTVLVAAQGNETLQGAFSSGNDTFFAGAGTALIGLGAGQDTVVAGAGAGTVLGGTGAETILVANGQAGGTLTVYGFRPGTDHIALSGFDAGEPDRALTSAMTGPSGTTLTLSDRTQVILLGLESLDRVAFA